MPSFESTRRVRFSDQQMFDLVADVEKYPLFLPLCESLVVKSRSPKDDGEELIATMGIGYKAIRESFTTRVLVQRPGRLILVEYLDGPFRHLENRWRFIEASGGSDVHFFIDYEFRSPILSVLMGAVFDKAFRKFAEAFEERAAHVYAGVPQAARISPV